MLGETGQRRPETRGVLSFPHHLLFQLAVGILVNSAGLKPHGVEYVLFCTSLFVESTPVHKFMHLSIP